MAAHHGDPEDRSRPRTGRTGARRRLVALVARGVALVARGVALVARGVALVARGVALVARGVALVARGVALVAAVALTGTASVTAAADRPGADPPEQAYFILQTRHLASPEWPAAFLDYRIFVCNPSFDVRHLAKIRRDVPGAICLAYVSAQSVPIGIYPNDSYYRSLTRAFDESLCIRDLERDRVVALHVTRRGVAIPSLVLCRESADVLVEFHRDVTMKTSWDGFFLDMTNAKIPAHRKKKLRALGVPLDYDGDGEPDDFDDLDRQHATWRPYFTQRMRDTFGDGLLLVGNSGGALEDPALNGITLEGAGDRFTVEECRRYLESQREVSVEPFCGILWAESVPSIRLVRDLAAELDGVLFGTMIEVGATPARGGTGGR